MNKKKKRKSLYLFLGSKLAYRVLVLIFIAQMVSFLTISIILSSMFLFGGWKFDGGHRPIPPLLILIIGCLIALLVGFVFSSKISDRILKPISDLKVAADKVAKGDFNVTIKYNVEEGEIAELINNFNYMTSELKKNSMLRNDFISNVSHEFKTPLSTIQGYATLLQDETLSDEERKKYIDVIIQSTGTLTTLVSDILKISKLDNNKVVVEKDNYQLDEQLREVILSLESKWSEKDIELEIELEQVLINSDKSLLSNVWSNLLSNAIKFTPKGGKIAVDLRIEDGYARISIKDNGVGISKENIPYIFDKFFQADRSHHDEGNGLGLSLVKRILSLLNSKITVESELNEGTEFVVLIPLEWI